MTRVASYAGLILGTMVPPAVWGGADHVALLSQARTQIVENIKKLPKYTCLQMVSRYRFDAIPPVPVVGCGYLDDLGSTDIQKRMMLAWTDRFKLDVTVSEGAEIFSWPGDQRFQSEDVDTIVGSGMAGTGDFGPFLMSIFGESASECNYLGLEQDNARAFAVYHYHVPISASHYQIKIGSQTKDMATMAYDGKFWIDPQNAELSRMTIEVSKPPRQSQTCRIETTITYRRARIGGFDFLLPQLTDLKLFDDEFQLYENRIEYASCRQFQSESVFRTDEEAAGVSEVRRPPVAIPQGIKIKVALHSKIDSQRSFAGDAIEGRLLNAIGVVVPAGSIVHGRIVRIEHRYQPSDFFALGLKFHSVEVNSIEVPITLVAVTRSRGERILTGPAERRQGIGMFMFQTDRPVLDQMFISEWKTASRKKSE
jgi:hypothetical protein